MFHVEQWPRYQATGCAPASARTSIACMQLEIEGPVFRKLPELARVICLGMSALDAIYRFPVIPATPVKVLATAFSECGRHPVPHRHRIRFLVDPNGERLICA